MRYTNPHFTLHYLKEVPVGGGGLLNPHGCLISYHLRKKSKKRKVNAAICIAHRHEHVFNALLLPVSRR